MMETDYIVVGLGLAGVAFCEELRKNGKTFVVVDADKTTSSKVAGGVYNPIVLKRFNKAWKADEQLTVASNLYRELEDLLHIKIDHPIPVLRKFVSVEEQNNWFDAIESKKLDRFLSAELVANQYSCVKANLGFGLVNETGFVDTITMLSAYRKYLLDPKLLKDQEMVYSELTFVNNSVLYQDIRSKHIVFAEGFGMKENPFFDGKILSGTKGEILIIKAPQLKVQEIIKSSVFVIPLGNDEYYVGATYDHHSKTVDTSAEAKDSLIEKLKTLIDCSFEVIDQKAGIRPTTKDRRPVVGRSSIQPNCYLLNGLGTRGVMVGPYVAKQLYEFIENNTLLDPEIDLARFHKP